MRHVPGSRERQILSLASIAALVASSLAGCGETWPGARGLADPQFLGHGRAVETVDILPIDLQVWTTPGRGVDPEGLAGSLQQSMGGMVSAQLARRGYRVVAQIDRGGRYVAPDGAPAVAMAPDDVMRTAYALSSYGTAQRESEGGALLVPFLPARLGATTGSDATLYVGGWAFAGVDNGPSKAGKVLKVVLIVGLVAVVAAAVVVGLKDGKHGGAVGKVAEGAGKVATGGVRVAGTVMTGVARTTGRVALAIASDPELFYLTVDTIDAFARAGTHVDYYSVRPDYYAEGPHDGRSAMLLEMTLIDNHTGRTLWHARQRFPASPERPQEVARAVATAVSSLPPQ
ncbi:MAG TPA: hypothetical protein VKB80_02320 [Kofleriaceae bacterium]|nr:hypothetical protein [Kofleriaceae bacterium]